MMKVRLSRSVLTAVTTLTLAPVFAVASPLPPASAAPLPAPYAASAHGDLVGLSAALLGLPSLANVRIGHSRADVDSSRSTGDSRAEAANLDASLVFGGINVPVGSQVATAAPKSDPSSADLLGSALDPLDPIVDVGLLGVDTYADYTSDNGCPTAVNGERVLSDSRVQLAGATVVPAGGLGNLASVGASTFHSNTKLVDNAVGGSDVVSTTEAVIGDIRLLGNTVRVNVGSSPASPVRVVARSNGTTGTVQLINPPTITATVGTTVTPIPLNGNPVNIATGNPLVTVTLNAFNQNAVVDNDGNATASANLQYLLRARVNVLPIIPGAPVANVDLNLAPLSVSATAPSGGVECSTPDVQAPAAPAITDPGAGDEVTDRTPAISGTGAEPGSVVTVYAADGTTVLCTDESVTADGTWSCSPGNNLPLGPVTVTATSTDAAGNESPQSPPVTFTIVDSPDTTAPDAPIILVPAGGSSTPDKRPTVSGTAEPNSSVLVTEDGTEICTAQTNALGIWSCSPDVDLAEGEHTFDAVAEDEAGNKSEADSVTFTIEDSTAPAAPVITAPANGDQTDDTTPTVTGTAEPGSTVTVTEGGNVVCTAVTNGTGNWSCIPTTPLDEGEHTFDAVAEDEAGNTSDPDTVTFEVNDTTAPTAPVIVLPADGSTTADTTPLVSGTAEPGSTVTVTEGGSTICIAQTGPLGNWSCTPTAALNLGVHTFAAVAADEAGNPSPSNSVTFTVTGITTPGDTTAPDAPLITTPANGSTTTNTRPTIGGTAEPGSTVTVTEGGVTICTTQTREDGTWSCNPAAAFTVAGHTITATATDAAGNTSPAATSAFTVVAGTSTDGGGQDDPDTDGDGLTDNTEVNTTKTDPKKADTDGDGLSDGREVNDTKTDPLNPDTDGDKLTDGQEVNGMVIKERFEVCGRKATNKIKVRTNPLNKDTDKDGLTDGVEVKGFKIKQKVMIKRSGKTISIGLTRTNPTKADTDRDGLKDKVEKTGKANKKFALHKTDPSKCDTDRGGVNDGREVKAGSDPSQIKSGPNDLKKGRMGRSSIG